MFNAKHSETVPRNFELYISAISQSWEEGDGLDMEGYTDLTYDVAGSNWVRRTSSTSWDTAGGVYFTDISSSFTASFDSGTEDMEVDISPLVEQWLNSAGNILGSKNNYGVIVRFPATSESATRSYYTKRFSSRSSEYFFKRPVIEARWDSSEKDNRGNFIISSSYLSPEDNNNTVYIYNYYRGQLKNLSHPNGDVS